VSPTHTVTSPCAEAQRLHPINENNRRAQALRAVIGRMPEPGTNTLIVTHKPNIVDALGRDWFDIREGEASVFKPDGAGGYALVGRVQIGQWAAAK